LNDCLIKNFSSIWVLTIASVFRGIGFAFFHVAFEAWLIQEYRTCVILFSIYIIALFGSQIIATNITKCMLVISFEKLNSNFICIIDIATALVSIEMGLFAQLLVEWGGFR
jgi:hypothetical protein